MRKSTLEPPSPDSGALPGILRASDLEARGVPRGHLQTLLRRGEVERVGRGLYRLSDAPDSELETVVAVCKRVPGAIVCLLTALTIHDIGTQLPRAVWIALDRKARRPHVVDLPIHVARFSGPMLRYGVETREVLGVPLRITSPARTVVDCFRYRYKIGIDVALEALADTIRSRKATVDEIMRAAEMCRARTVMRTYLEALLP